MARQKSVSRTRAVDHGSKIRGRKEDTILAPLKSPSASERAYIAIERLLVTGHIAPHSIVNEMEICKSLGLGRTPVRLALQRLADHGLQAHVEQLGKYTDADMHDVLAYLQTLK